MTPIEKYAAENGYKIAKALDENMALIVKPCPSWVPLWLYRKVIHSTVEIVSVQVPSKIILPDAQKDGE